MGHFGAQHPVQLRCELLIAFTTLIDHRRDRAHSLRRVLLDGELLNADADGFGWKRFGGFSQVLVSASDRSEPPLLIGRPSIPRWLVFDRRDLGRYGRRDRPCYFLETPASLSLVRTRASLDPTTPSARICRSALDIGPMARQDFDANLPPHHERSPVHQTDLVASLEVVRLGPGIFAPGIPTRTSAPSATTRP